MFERPLVLWLLAAIPLMAIPGVMAMRAGRSLAGALSAALRMGLYAVLILLLAGARVPINSAARRMAIVVAVDQSESIASDQRDWMTQRLAAIRHAMDPRDRLAVIDFGRDAQLAAPLGDPRMLALTMSGADAGATDIAGALTTAAGIFPPGDEKRLILLTDGVETENSAMDELPALAEAAVRVYSAAPPPSRSDRIALTSFGAPSSVHAATSFALHFDIASEARHQVDAHIRLYSENSEVGGQQIELNPGMNRFELPYRIDQPGAYILRAEVEAAPGLALVNAQATAAVSVAQPPRVLLIANTPPESLVKALALRNFDVANAGPHGLSPHAADYLGYQAVIIANVAASALAPEIQSALNRYVADYGGGLIVTGDTLRDSKFHGGPLERTLPIEFEEQPPPPSREPIAVYLLIDRSNSMSYNSRYPAVRDGERIHYAKEAAIALLNQLDDTDYAGVMAFDSEPYVLGHLRPLGENRAELLSRVARLEPGGGTDFKDALEIAEKRDSRYWTAGARGDPADRRRHQSPISRSRPIDGRIRQGKIFPSRPSASVLTSKTSAAAGLRPRYRRHVLSRRGHREAAATAGPSDPRGAELQESSTHHVEVAAPVDAQRYRPHRDSADRFFCRDRAKDGAEVPLKIRKPIRPRRC